MNKTLVGVVIVAIVIVGGYFLFEEADTSCPNANFVAIGITDCLGNYCWLENVFQSKWRI